MLLNENSIYSFFAFAFGAVVGSFANVCIFRLPLETSIVSPRSRCIRCGTFLSIYANLPIVSYVALRGRCSSCGTPLSPVYPLSEMLLGVAATMFFVPGGIGFRSIYFFILFTALWIASAIDLKHRIIPDVISIPGIFLGLLATLFANWLHLDWPVSFIQSIAGIVVGGGFLWGIGSLYERVTGREGIGFGDVKLLALFGAHFGVQGVMSSLFFGSVFGSLVGLFMILFYGKSGKYPIPFGPFLCFGLLLHALGGDRWLFFLNPSVVF